jgi:FMN phosphatase YigB (HAD superfamily)
LGSFAQAQESGRMPLTLEQYATYLDTRDLAWPAAPEVKRPKARPHVTPMPEVRAVLWNVYGTLLSVSGGGLYFEHPQPLITNVALDKTLTEFKMWASMSRRPGQPAEYLGQIYQQVLLEQQLPAVPGEKHPGVSSEKVWESIIKKLFQKDYQFDAGFFGSLNEFSRKVAYFFHASLQGSACYRGAAQALRHVAAKGLTQALLADGQCFTAVQLQRGLSAQDESANLDELIPPSRRWLSCDLRAKKPSERLFRAAVDALREQGIETTDVLHVGSRITQDLLPAKRLGMRTALFAGDKASLEATAEQLKDPHSRPDVLLTKLKQIKDIVGE